MQQYYRKPAHGLKPDHDVDFQIFSWWSQDESHGGDSESEGRGDNDASDLAYTIRCFGVTESGKSVTCKITGFKPFYYIKVKDTMDRAKLARFLTYMEEHWALREFAVYEKRWDPDEERYIKTQVSSNAMVRDKCGFVEKKDLFGFRNGKFYRYIKLVFNTYKAMSKSRYIFKKAITIPKINVKPVKFKLYESNFEPFMRYCHLKDIRTAGWIRLPRNKYNVTEDTATTQLEVQIDRNDVVSLASKQAMANCLQASWDIEVYSHDYTFPDPQRRPNEIFQIATTYKHYNDSELMVKHLLTLKGCAPIHEPDVVVECCANEKELIKRWIDTIAGMDPDVLYTYNGDSFDCMYLYERAKMYGMVHEQKQGRANVQTGYLLERWSRLTNTPAVKKTEFFSSSAYGDSEFQRMYIPGRLNYDLLIHFKRGMKKYSSYKLDNIANEILGEGKHDVSAKDIFKSYERGTPEAIREIGEYCIQDTHLLQKLVDKQLILITIVQLANVTFVPIEFLTTRGQTIKVYSQILRKARQMDFLVPHTNFNEDSYPVHVKFREPHNLDDAAVGEYVSIHCGARGDTSTVTLSGKVDSIVDEGHIIVLIDTEITRDYYNVVFKRGYSQTTVARVWPCDDLLDDSFTGATVLEPLPGMYENNIAVLDFSSLYPSVLMSRNLCFSTFVMDPKYLDIPGVKYERIAWDDTIEYKLRHTCDGVGKSGKSKGLVCGKQAFFEEDGKFYCRIHDPCKKTRSSDEKFQRKDVSYDYVIVQPDERGVNKGVVPALLQELYAERKRVKREMAKANADGDYVLADILDSTQLAIKVSLNSTYGFLGRRQGSLILKELGSIVTSVGRMLIEQSKEYAEGPFLDMVRQSQLVTHTLKRRRIDDLTEHDKLDILKRFVAI